MTREELNKLIMQACKRTWNEKTCKEIEQALSQEPTYYPPCMDCNKKMDEIRRAYDKLKEQEPRTDAISREDAYEIVMMPDTPFGKHKGTLIRELPPVTQKSETVTEFADRCRECGKMRKGHWVYDETIENWRCSKCNETPKTMGYVGTADFMAEHFKFCNHCGCRMVEPQESEE